MGQKKSKTIAKSFLVMHLISLMIAKLFIRYGKKLSDSKNFFSDTFKKFNDSKTFYLIQKKSKTIAKSFK
jgi:hypothetical protein